MSPRDHACAVEAPEDEQDASPPPCCIDARGEYEPCREHSETPDESYLWDEIMGRVRV